MDLAAIFERARCTGFVHAVALDGSRRAGLDADASVVPASVVKVLIAVEAENQMYDGTLDPTARVRIGDAERTPGPVGLSLLQDPVELSVRDLVPLMLTLSDNVATDAVLARVGLGAVNETARRLGLTSTVLATDIRGLIDSIARDAGFEDWAGFVAWRRDGADGAEGADEGTALRRLSVARALSHNPDTRTTARDMTTLLRRVWEDEAGPPEACARVRDHMARQLTRSRLARGFRGASVAAKSGGLMGIARNEIGVVRFPEGDGYAVAVFTHAADPTRDEHAVDDAIGAAAAAVVAGLR